LCFFLQWFKKKNKKALYEALEKVKAGKFIVNLNHYKKKQVFPLKDSFNHL